jgi:DNA polymerase V
MGITTAAQLRDAPSDTILGEFGMTLARTQRELQGHACIELEEVTPDKKQIMVSRSFADRVEDHEAVAQALATFAVRACEKLRRDGLVAGAVGIFALSDRFRAELPQHAPSRMINMPAATDDSRLILSIVRQLFRRMLKAGIGYKKAGVTLTDLSRPEDRQGDLFTPAVAGNAQLMATLDGINRKFGRGVAGLGATGWKERPEWGMRQNLLSPNYTTRVTDLPRLHC